MAKSRSAKRGRAWKLDRTTGRKYSDADRDRQPSPGDRQKFWVSGYTRQDGTKVEGYYKTNPAYKGAKRSSMPGVSKKS